MLKDLLLPDTSLDSEEIPAMDEKLGLAGEVLTSPQDISKMSANE
jgi:hypothetical protein